MERTIDDLRMIAAAGGGFALDAKQYLAHDLRTIAAASRNGKASMLRIINAENLTSQEVASIAKSGGGCVFFELGITDR